MERYLVVIGKTSTGYSAHSPDVPGCATVGKTLEGCVARMKKALEFHLEGLAEDGDPIPKARGVVSYRKVTKELDSDGYFLVHIRIDTDRIASTAASA